MELEAANAFDPLPVREPLEVQFSAAGVPEPESSLHDASSRAFPFGTTSWAKPQRLATSQDGMTNANTGKSAFSRFTSGLSLKLSPKSPLSDDVSSGANPQPGFFGTITKGIVDSSKNAVKAVQVKARHAVSQNKRRYQEGEFDLDMTYITENVIAMGFPAGDMSSGFLGFVEGFYRNHMEEVIRFFETHHKDKYKVYNLCSERLYDVSLLEGKVASFPFEDHNCPPIQLVISFCHSAYSWLKEDLENVVVVHCKAGMARTGLMISSLLLFLKFFPTAEESMLYYNQRRCIDGKGLVLPSQIRYVKYFERVLTNFNGANPPPRRCMLRGIRLHRCPYWIRPAITISNHSGVLFSTKKHPKTKDLTPEDYWFNAPKKGVMVFALPGEPGLTELCGDFKVHFHDHQGDFYFWLNTTLTENRKVLTTNDLDGFDKRKLPSPGFQVEVVLADYDANVSAVKPEIIKKSDDGSSNSPTPVGVTAAIAAPSHKKDSESHDGDDVFSDGEADEFESSKSKQAGMFQSGGVVTYTDTQAEPHTLSDQVANLTNATGKVSLGSAASVATHGATEPKSDAQSSTTSREPHSSQSDFKAMAADASVFSFGDDEDYESE